MNRIERAIINFTIQFVTELTCQKLIKIANEFIATLKEAVTSAVDGRIEAVRCTFTEEISAIAPSWENTSLHSWIIDLRFFTYFAIISTNEPQSI